MIAIIDYDAGNIKSVEKAFQFLGQEAEVTRDRERILKADKVVLPGVGAFGDAMAKLAGYGLTEVIREAADRGRQNTAWRYMHQWKGTMCLRASFIRRKAGKRDFRF